jgi:predicted dehydrogenase
MKTIKWGIIGCGKIANKFATDLATISNTTLHAVASRSKERATAFAEKYNAITAYDSYEALATDTNVDAVYVATPHSFHATHAILCLQNKKAVLCEKPFAMNRAEVEEMIATAKENDTLLMEALWTYFLPQYQYVLKVLESKKYGKLNHVEADFGFYLPFDNSNRLFLKEVGGGSLLDIGIYAIFAALSTLGIPEEIKAEANFFENGADKDCTMYFNYKEASAKLHSNIAKETNTEAIFTCENGTIKIHTRFHEPSTITIVSGGTTETLDFTEDTIGYKHEAIHFNNLIRAGKKESDVMTFDFSRNLITLLDQVREQIGLEYN